MKVSSSLSRASAEGVEDALDNFMPALKNVSSASKELLREIGARSRYMYAQAPKILSPVDLEKTTCVFLEEITVPHQSPISPPSVPHQSPISVPH